MNETLPICLAGNNTSSSRALGINLAQAKLSQYYLYLCNNIPPLLVFHAAVACI